MNSGDAGNLLPNGFYPLLRSHLPKLSVGKKHISKPLLFFFFSFFFHSMKNFPADTSLHQHPSFTGCSSLHSQLRQWRGGEETMGGLGGRVRRRETEGVHTHTDTHTGEHPDRRRVVKRERSCGSAIRLS